MARGPMRTYRMLLRMLPRSLRARHEQDLAHLSADMYGEWQGKSRRAKAAFWFSLITDLITGSVAERFSPASTRGRRTHSLGDVMSTLLLTLRHAARQLLSRKAYAATIILLVAIGVSGNAAVFRLFDGLFLRPLPFDESEQLVDVDVTAPQWNLEFASVSITDFNDWREENTTFEAITAVRLSGGNLTGPAGPVRISTLRATHDVDDVLRLTPAIGQFFSEDQDRPEAAPVAMLSQGFWKDQFDGSPSVLGQTVRIDGVSTEIIGVLPPEGDFLVEVDVWLPLREDDESSFYLRGIGRLKPGVTPAQAKENLVAIHQRHVPDRPVNEITSPTVMPLRDRYLGPQRLGFGVLLGAVGVVLLIACANIAGLMLARSVSRTDELALRAALGAGRFHLIQHLLAEAVLLAGVGGLLGVILGTWGSEKLVLLLAGQFPAFTTFGLDGRFLAFVVGVTVLTVLISGVGPALRSSRMTGTLSAGTRTTAPRAVRRGMNALVVGEVALATVLLVVSGLAVADIRALGQTEPGFKVDDALSYRVAPSFDRYDTPEKQLQFWQQYEAALLAQPTIERVTLGTMLPLMGHSGWFFDVEGNPDNEEGTDDSVVVLRNLVTPGFFSAMEIPLLSGRGFTEFDGRGDDTFVAVVNESFVRTHIPRGQNPIGQRIRTDTRSPWETIVGVTPDVKHDGIDQPTKPNVFEPIRQRPALAAQVFISSKADPAAVLADARAATKQVDSDLPIFDTQLVRDRIDSGLLTRRAGSWLIALFSVVALLLAAAGLYGVVSYGVGQRASEMGIRLALGAQRRDVKALVVRQGLLLVGLGLAIGAAGAAAVARSVSGALVATSGNDPRIFAGVVGVVLGIALLANFVPARRAADVNIIRLLRRD